MSIINISSNRIGREPSCGLCGAGSTISFNWEYAKTATQPENRRDLSVFVESKALRYGIMFECKACRQPWYRCGSPAFMNFVAPERLALIERWNEQPIVLSREHLSALQAIGRPPPDLYGNGSEFHETPCSVTTTDGERIDLAVVSMQRHAPFEEWRNCRLATDIAEVRPSPHALPLSIRVASAQADEVRMGFAPTFVELPNAEQLVLNWTQSFVVRNGCDASGIRLSQRRPDWKNLPEVYAGTVGVVYFVADHCTTA